MHKIPWVIVIDTIIAINTRNYRDIFFKPVSPIPNSNALNFNIIRILVIFKYKIQI